MVPTELLYGVQVSQLVISKKIRWVGLSMRIR